jgi:hypothetical protein
MPSSRREMSKSQDEDCSDSWERIKNRAALIRAAGFRTTSSPRLLYHLALLGGLEMIERHPRSIDLYREDDRFARLNAKHAWLPKQVEFAREHLPESESGARVRVATVIEGQVLVQTEYLQRPGMVLT